MKVTVIGANGKIGKQVVDLLHNNDKHTVKAMVRKEEQLNSLKESGVDAVLADLEGSVDHIAEAVKGSDAVVFTAGSGGKTGPDKTMLVDMDGAIKSVEAAEKAGVNRFIMVSAQHADDRDSWADSIRHYYAAKHYADRALKESQLDYTIVRPGLLTDVFGTGKISIGDSIPTDEVPRADVAEIIVTVLDKENTFKKSFELTKGDTSIKDAIQGL